jgi:hypothetical protein
MRVQHQWWKVLVTAVLGGLVGVTTVAAGEQFIPLLVVREGANRSIQIGSSPSLRPSSKARHTRPKCAFAYCVHFADHTPSAGSA